MQFREEPVTPVYRHWMCEQLGCDGELLSTGEGITRLSTRWKHRCGKCGHEDWADATYPRVAYLPVDPSDLTTPIPEKRFESSAAQNLHQYPRAPF
jgi:hypothetical protein